MFNLSPLVVCSVTVSDSRTVCYITASLERPPPLNEVSYAEVLNCTDLVEALTFISLAGIVVYCVVRAVTRGSILRRARRDSLLLFTRIADALYIHDRPRTINLLSSSTENPLARVISAGLDAACVGKRAGCSDGGVSWSRNLAVYIETREWRRGLWDLNVAACIAPVITALFGYYVMDWNAPKSASTVKGSARAFYALAFSVCISASAFSLRLWLATAADDLCQSLDHFSNAILDRLLHVSPGSDHADSPASSYCVTTTSLATRTRPLYDRSPFISLRLND